jgi:hypothetical protein
MKLQQLDQADAFLMTLFVSSICTAVALCGAILTAQWIGG